MDNIKIIAEIGLNHNGDIETAKELIKKAKWCDADIVKFQKRNLDKVYSQEYLKSKRDSPWGNTQREQKEHLEFGRIEYDIINAYCKALKIDWTASPWDLDSLNFLNKYDLKYNKVASAMLTYEELITRVAEQKKYTFISTGMSTIKEIERAVNIFRSFNCPFELMHCNSQYPLPDEYVNLKCIDTLKKRFNCKVGYSCHSVEMIVPVYAVALGATSIEKHITLNRAMYGTDQSASMEVEGFRKMVKYIRMSEVIVGNGEKTVTPGELECLKKLRRNFDY